MSSSTIKASEGAVDDDNFDFAGPGLPTTITLTPREVLALQTIGAGQGLLTLSTYYRPTNLGVRNRDEVDSFDGYRQEFQDAVATLQRLADRMYTDQIRQPAGSGEND